MQYLHPPIKRNEITPLIVFSFFISLSVVLSNHIQITAIRIPDLQRRTTSRPTAYLTSAYWLRCLP